MFLLHSRHAIDVLGAIVKRTLSVLLFSIGVFHQILGVVQAVMVLQSIHTVVLLEVTVIEIVRKIKRGSLLGISGTVILLVHWKTS